jgi:hypothetical protein
MVAALGQIDSLAQEYDRRIHASVVSLYSYQDQSSFAAIVKFIPESINSFKSSLRDIETTNHQYWDELEPSVHDYGNLLTLTAQAAADLSEDGASAGACDIKRIVDRDLQRLNDRAGSLSQWYKEMSQKIETKIAELRNYTP